MLRLSPQTADSYSHGFSAFMSGNKICADRSPSLMSSRRPPSVGPMFAGAHNQGLARRIPANTGNGFLIANTAVVA